MSGDRPQLATATASDLTRLACLWAEQELCGRRPAKCDPFAWACREKNLDSFLLFVRLKQLPKVPTFADAVVQQRRVVEEEAVAAGNQRGLADRLIVQLPTASTGTCYNMFDDAEGDCWQEEPGDWWHSEGGDPSNHMEMEPTIGVDQSGESVQAALNARRRRTTRLTFFDDESGEDGLQLEPDDFNLVTGLVDRRGWPEFAKAKKFAGAWLGMVFKRGPQGMGYYRDVPKTAISLVQMLPAVADASPIVLQLDQVIPERKAKHPTRSEEPDTCPRRKRTSTGRKSKGEGLDLEWPCDASLTAASTFHVALGQWAFETVNGSCWNTAANYLTQTAADFVAVQETTVLADNVPDTEQAARNKGWKAALTPCNLTKAEGKSAGTAVCCRTHIGARKSFDDDCCSKWVRARFQMKHLGAVCKGGVHFGSCYLQCNWEHNRAFNLDLLQCIAAVIGTLRGPWILGGDWQCPPDELRSTGWLKTVKGVIYAPEAPTCGDRVLDYYVVSEELAQAWAIVAACVIGDATFGPHRPVRLIVKATTRTVMVRQLDVPFGFKADLPFGPMPQRSSPVALCDHQAKRSSQIGNGDPSCDVLSNAVAKHGTAKRGGSTACGGVDNYSNSDGRSLEELGKDYNGLIDTIEDELCAIEGLEGRQAEAKKGRATGARFCWKPALGDDTAGAAKTTSASRAWRKTAKWLGDVLHTKCSGNAESARWKVRFYRHPKPDRAVATDEQLMSVKVFEDWRSTIRTGQLHSKPWLEMLKQVAEKQADRQEAAAQLASMKNYQEWINDGAGCGLKRQHQFSRNAIGWTETALDRCSSNEVGEHDDLEGLSEEQIEAIRDKVSDDSAPADVQAEVNDQAMTWKTVWGGDLADKSDPAWPEDIGVIPPMVLVQALIDAAMSFPKETGLGWDRLHPRALCRLSHGTLVWVCVVLHNAEKERQVAGRGRVGAHRPVAEV